MSIFASDILGLPPATSFGPFRTVHLGNGITMDFLQADGQPASRHYAFHVSEAEFTDIMGRIEARKVRYWADPGQQREGEIDTRDGGHGAYFEDPNGHLLEILTHPYGGH